MRTATAKIDDPVRPRTLVINPDVTLVRGRASALVKHIIIQVSQLDNLEPTLYLRNING